MDTREGGVQTGYMTPRACRLSLLLACAVIITTAHARDPAAQPAEPVALAGSWVLNASLSDDPQAALDEFDRGTRRDRERDGARAVQAPPITGEAGRDESSLPVIPDEPTRDAAEDPPPPPRRINDAEAEFLLLIGTPRAVEISLADGVVRLDSDDRRREYRSGGTSVVSFGRGVAERKAGWRGSSFVVQLRAVDGPRIDDRLSLDEAGRLVWTTEARGAGYPRIEVERVYDRKDAQ